MKLIRSSNTWHISKAYRGILPAALGAIPSSALYFGAYESSKITLQQLLLRDNNESTTSKRLVVHGLAAACGNIISSAVFVPKEVIKQQLQYLAATSVSSTHASSSVRGVVLQLIQKKGIKGLYSGYQATLMRNIPSAMIRFVLYEELKILWGYREGKNGKQEKRAPIGLFAAGAVAGAMASGLMTPVDVLKTRMATGTCPLGVKSCLLHVVKEVGWQGLYAGGGSRMMWSGAFSSIGFGTFEFVKGMLGVASINDEEQNL